METGLYAALTLATEPLGFPVINLGYAYAWT